MHAVRRDALTGMDTRMATPRYLHRHAGVKPSVLGAHAAVGRQHRTRHQLVSERSPHGMSSQSRDQQGPASRKPVPQVR